MRVLRGPRITGVRTSFSRAGEPANLAAAAGNVLKFYLKKREVLLYTLIPLPVLPQHLLLDLSGEGLEDGAEGLEEAEGVCLHVRERGRQDLKAGARLLPHQGQRQC